MVNDRVTWKCVIVRKSPLNQNLSSVLLLDFCVHHGLSLFKHKGTYLAIWLYPRLQCDDRLCSCVFELVAAGLRHLVQDRADLSNDQHLVVCWLRLRRWGWGPGPAQPRRPKHNVMGWWECLAESPVRRGFNFTHILGSTWEH